MATADPKQRTALEHAMNASRGTFAVVGVFSFFINILMLTVPMYMLQIYDRVLASGSQNTLVMLTILAAGLLVTVGLLDFARSRVLVRLGARLDSRVNCKLMSAMLRNRLHGDCTSQGQPLRDLDGLRAFLTGPALMSFFDAPWTPIFILVIFLFHPVLGFIALGGALVLLVLAVVNEVITRQPLAQASEVTINANGFAESSLRNAEVIHAMGMMPGLLSRWTQRHELAMALQARASDRASTVTATVRTVRQLLQVAMLGCGAYLAIRQIITPGVMIVASIIMARALAPVEFAITSWRGFVSARAGYARLRELMAQGELDVEPMQLPNPLGAVSVESAVVVPPGTDKPVLAGVSFSLLPGELLGVIGPSGAGKSTLARMLVGVWPPTAGRARLDGADVSQWDNESLGPHIGYVPQDVELFDGTIAENIARFSEADAAMIVHAAERARAHEMILALPNGYDTVIGEAGGALSGGQRQRIALARALYGDPVLVVLDEPNSNLDAQGDEALRAAIAELKHAQKTVVVIAHRPSIMNIADKLLVLRAGRVESFGPRADVLPHVTQAHDTKNGAGLQGYSVARV